MIQRRLQRAAKAVGHRVFDADGAGAAAARRYRVPAVSRQRLLAGARIVAKVGRDVARLGAAAEPRGLAVQRINLGIAEIRRPLKRKRGSRLVVASPLQENQVVMRGIGDSEGRGAVYLELL